jgi:hypothetical protein
MSNSDEKKKEEDLNAKRVYWRRQMVLFKQSFETHEKDCIATQEYKQRRIKFS